MKRMVKLSRSALIGLAALVMLSCALCAVILVFVPDVPDEPTAGKEPTAVVERASMTDTGDPTPADTLPTPVEPTEAKPTAAPTQTPQPTATPRPTTTPRPTATPNAVATTVAREAGTSVAAAQADLLAEMAYTEEILQISTDYVEALEGIAAQSEAASNNPYLIANDEWTITTAVYLAALRVAGDDVRALNPPTRFAAAHDGPAGGGRLAEHLRLLLALNDAQGVDELDAGKLELATINMQLGFQFRGYPTVVSTTKSSARASIGPPKSRAELGIKKRRPALLHS